MSCILAITSMYPPHAHGGYERACRYTMERFAQWGHEVTVLATDARRDGVDDPDIGPVEVIRELRWYWHDHELLDLPVRVQLARERHNHRTMTETLERVRPDVISLWSLGGMPLGVLSTVLESGIPTVFVVFDDWLLYAADLDPWSRRFRRHPRLAALGRRLLGVPTAAPDLRALDRLVFISDCTRQRARDRGGIDITGSTVVHAGVESEQFTPGTGPGDDERPWAWSLLYVGRLDPRKSIDTAVRALTHLPDAARLTIDGSGDPLERARLDGLVEELGVGDRVTFVESDAAQLAERYRSADAVLFTSSWHEPFGMVPLEAMACGTPVVATGVGGSGEYLEDGVNCLLYPPGDHAELAAAIERLASNEPLRRRLIASGADTASGLSLAKMARTLHDEHGAVLATRSAEVAQAASRPA